ncbi:MAG: cytochrome c3 family protein, partial [Bdellovibrionales bacterium]
TTSGCHANLKAARYVHAPIKATNSCVLCHKVTGEGSKHPKLQTVDKANINSVCLKCHDNILSPSGKHGGFQHTPIASRTCLACHDPHKSQFPHLTKVNPEMALCLTCHKEFADRQKTATHHKIANMDKGCLSCHNAHTAGNANLLKKNNPAEVCLSCHEKEVQSGDRVIPSIKSFFVGHQHPPVAEGQCFKCHQIHGSTKANLLQKNYSPNLYETFSTGNSELCFQCHKEGLATVRKTTQETRFRNGDLNLHALHLLEQKKQRTCQACHDVHSSPQPHLIRPTFTYKDYQLPIQYTVLPDGGKCATACHHDMTYNRERVFKNEPR